MADVKLNALIDGLSGRVGKNVVMRQREGRTFLTSRPKGSATVSEKQQAQRDRFQQAVGYSKNVLLIPAIKAEYEVMAKRQAFISPFTAAVTDYLTEPKIVGLDVSGYKGVAGNPLVVHSSVDYKLISVTVTLQQPDGTLVESGEAASSGTRLEWVYVATQNVASLAGLKLTVTATDRPGNVVTKEQVF